MEDKQIKIEDLPISAVDPHSPVPLYHQILLDLRGLITSEKISPGSVLPPELEICKAYGVGRQTVRMAIAKLVDDNLVERYAGRGTFVRLRTDRMKFYLDRSFTQQMKELGYVPRSEVIQVAKIKIDDSSPEPLRMHRGEDYFNLIRLRYGDHEPVCVQDTSLLAELCPGLEQHDFSCESLYEVLSNDYHMVINSIHHIVRAVSADEDLAELLRVPVGSPLLYVGTTAFSEDKRVVECTSSYYRADKYEYSTLQIYCE
jgi:GntR family transcriptional regulator